MPPANKPNPCAIEKAVNEAIAEANARIEKGLVRIFEEVMGEPELLVAWGQAARDRMLRTYDPEDAAQRLEALYDSIEG